MPINTPPEHDEDVDAIKQRLVQIVAEEFNCFGKTGQTIPDREIVRRLGDSTFGCPDMLSLRIIGSIQQWDDFNKQMMEEAGLALRSGHVLRVRTGYDQLPEFPLLVLDFLKEELTGLVKKRVRSLRQIGLVNPNLPQHEVDVMELIKAIRMA